MFGFVHLENIMIRFPSLFCAAALLGFAAFCSLSAFSQSSTRTPLQAILVGGGPDTDNNQAAIEGNIRYLNRLLPPQTPRTTLFADGNSKSETVLFDVESDASDRANRLWKMLFEGKRPDPDSWVATRAPRLNSRLDGASNEKNIARAFAKVRSSAPLLAYFTGHGGENERDSNNNNYNLWGQEELSVRELARDIARLPQKTPVTLVMVQCYSGAFGNVLFQDGDPKKPLIERDIAGFFASTNDRMAAGCTSEVDEAEYHDFTSYFFAAATGRDRVGRAVTGVDFNRDGRVGGDEAFAYALARDRSIDVPTNTSDVFLRRFAKVSDAQRSSTRWSQLRAWALPSQRFALDELSKELKLSGENRVAQARRLSASASPSMLAEIKAAFSQGAAEGVAQDRYDKARLAARERVLVRWPLLSKTGERAKLKGSVIQTFEREIDAAQWSELFEADAAVTQLQMKEAQAESDAENAQAHALRLVRLSDSVLLRRNLQSGQNARLKPRLARLLHAESRSVLPPVARLR